MKQKVSRKILSSVLSICMILGIFTAIPIMAMAADSNNDGYHDGDVAALNALIAAHPETGLSQWTGNMPPEDWGWWSSSNHRVQWMDTSMSMDV